MKVRKNCDRVFPRFVVLESMTAGKLTRETYRKLQTGDPVEVPDDVVRILAEHNWILEDNLKSSPVGPSSPPGDKDKED